MEWLLSKDGHIFYRPGDCFWECQLSRALWNWPIIYLFDLQISIVCIMIRSLTHWTVDVKLKSVTGDGRADFLCISQDGIVNIWLEGDFITLFSKGKLEHIWNIKVQISSIVNIVFQRTSKDGAWGKSFLIESTFSKIQCRLSVYTFRPIYWITISLKCASNFGVEAVRRSIDTEKRGNVDAWIKD